MVVDNSRKCMPDRSDIVLSIVQQVADCKDVDPMELPPLYEAIDHEGLEGIVEGPALGYVSVQFSYAGCDVTVESTDEMTIRVESSSPQLA